MTSTLTTTTSAASSTAQTLPGTDTMDALIDQACRTLRLPTICDRYDEIAASALRQQSSYKSFLLELLETEVEHRDERRRDRLVREAKFPRAKRIDTFDFAANPHIVPEVINTLTEPGWVSAGQPLCLIGDSGTGKSHLLIGIGTAIAEAGLRVRYTTTANLVNELVEAADERQLTRVLNRYSKVDLLCLDELGYLELDKAGAKLLFQILTDREERSSIAVASNAPFSEWPQTFADKRLCSAIVDRLTYNGHIVETGTESYRLRTTQQRLAD
jgi:DNA replication protein DnaC